MISKAVHLQCPALSFSCWVSALEIWKIQRNVYTHLVVPQTINCNCNLVSRPSTSLSLNLHFLISSAVLPKTEEIGLKRGLRRKTQKIFLIPYHKAGVLDKDKEDKPAKQKPYWMKPKTPRPNLQGRFQLSWPQSP